MKKIIPFPNYAAIEETAASWLIRIDLGTLSFEQQQELRAWLSQDPRHRIAFTRMAQLWGEMDALNLLAQLFPLEIDRKPAVARAAAASRNRLHYRPLGAVLAAAVCAGLAAMLPLLLKHADFPAVTEPAELVYQTDAGRQSQARLKDGSLITLNAQSKLRVRFTEKERSIYLVDGEAHFEVAKNPRYPFVVYAGTGEVRAVGTAFSVRVDNQQQVDVAVSEGTVQVVASLAPAAAAKNTRVAAPKPRPTSLTLKKGGTASYHETIESYGYVDQEKLEQKLAWKDGKWIFDGETLAEVVAEVNRYSGTHIQIADPALADLRVGGYFNAGDVDALLAALEAGFNIKAQRSADSIQLSSLSASPSSVR